MVKADIKYASILEISNLIQIKYTIHPIAPTNPVIIMYFFGI